MGETGAVLVLVASLWASVNAIVAGYEAVNRTRDRIVVGEIDGEPLTLAHRELMFRNDWIPLKLGLSMASLAFGLVVLFLPALLEMPPVLRTACYVVAVLPLFSFVAFFVLGIADATFIRSTLAAAREVAPLRAADDDPNGRLP